MRLGQFLTEAAASPIAAVDEWTREMSARGRRVAN
jgi:hypothetical protein